ncbi:MAG: glutamate-cysteine ligase family protein, partial [Tabrizicola sp.]|nr:glutamate-cysteine ligase family protein [Tabrizicola sp.]
MQKLAIAFDDPVAWPAVPHSGGARVRDVLAARYAAILNRPQLAHSQVGVELEFPLCTRTGQALTIEDDVVGRIATALGLEVVGRSDTGEVITVRTTDGQVTIGYEYARAVLEIALAPARDCLALSDLLGKVLGALDAVLADLGLYLGDSGLHPQAWSRTAPPLPTPHYRAIDRFLKSATRGGDYHRFTGFIASCQTHVDACAATAPLLSETFRRA